MKLLDRLRRDDGALDPVRSMAPGITVHDSGAVWAWVTLPTRSTDDLNTADIFRLTAEGAGVLRRLIPTDTEFQFKIQWGRWDGDGYVAEELAQLGDGCSEGAERYVRIGGQRINANGFPHRQVLLGILLATEDGSAGDALRRGTRRIAGPAAEVEDASATLRRAAKAARAFHKQMAASTFAAHASTVKELAWALRRDLRRSVNWLPDGPLVGSGELARLVSGCYAVPAADHMAVETDTGTRLVRMLTAAQKGFPTNDMELPGSEWLKELTLADDLEAGPPVPVEVSIRGRNLTATDAAKLMTEALALAKEQHREAAAGVAEEPPEEIVDARAVLPQRIKEVRQGTVGMVQDSVVWIVEAGSPEELDSRSAALIEHYGGQGISLWAPEHVQDVLYRETVLGDRWRFRDTQQLRPWTTLVGGWFHGGSVVGSATGPVLGGVIGSTPGPYRNRVSDAALEGKPVTSVYVGRSGSGKSTGVNLSCLAEAVYGAAVYLTDHKGDLRGICDAARSFGVRVTEVSGSEQASGSMCPFRYVANPLEAASMVTDNLLMMLRLSAADAAEPLVRAAANIVAAREDAAHRSTHEVIELLRHATITDADGHKTPNVPARAVGDQLAELAVDPLARSVAGPYDPDAPQLPTGPGLVYMRLDDSRMPGRQSPQATWKAGQRLSVMRLQAAYAYITYMAGRVKGIPKVVALTELHLISGYDFGRELIGNLALLGRALDVSLLLDTQVAAHLVGIVGLMDNLSTVHAFQVDSDEEADAQAKLLGLQPEPLIRARQKAWRAGECEVRDRDGRLAPVAFDYLTADIATALNTTPERVRAEPTQEAA